MKLLDALQHEHALIDQVLGSFRSYVDARVSGDADPDDGRHFAAFFAVFAGRFHHEREESMLFSALVREAELPGDRGPLYALGREHTEMEAWQAEMRPLLEQGPLSAADLDRLRAMATRYCRALWRHIDAENSVLFPQAEERLARCGVHELDDRPMNPAEAAARSAGAALLQRYPQVDDQGVTRGDGCFLCRAHGETCNGLEAEWWTEQEWDEFNTWNAYE